MSDVASDPDLANEQAANNNYREAIRIKSERAPEISVPASSKWTGSALPRPEVRHPGPLVGRVGLAGIDSVVDSDNFYIGPWKHTDDSLTVFSWAAPVSAAFYGIDSDTYKLDHPVAIRRVFNYDTSGTQIHEVFDEQVTQELHHNPFEVRRQLNIPSPPKTPASEVAPRDPDEMPMSTSEMSEVSQPLRATTLTPPPLPEPPQRTPSHTPLRAESALRAALNAPRTRSLPTLLATLQPDQYDFVTRTTDKPLVIQGHPGTGKTVIAAHRAAFMVHPDNNPHGLAPKILMVGPTTSYAQHVSGILNSLIPHNTRNRVTVVSVSQALGLMRQQNIKVSGPLDGEFFEVSIDLGNFTEAAAYELRMNGSLDRLSHLQAGELVYETVRSNRIDGLLITDDPDWTRHLRSLPPWNGAIGLRRLHPLVTQCIWSASEGASLHFDHIIVDEAQDVRPLEWKLLTELMIEPSWTILGDLNQRRSDASYASWTHIARDIGLVAEDEDFEPEQFTLGYRSTQQIMDFANSLLPRSERVTLCIQNSGDKPVVQKASPNKLLETVVANGQELYERYQDGSVAVITPDAPELVKVLRKSAWVRDETDQYLYKHEKALFHVLSPELARGLEFDAVIVVEPKSFPENLGRQGALYTSLTRANKELRVIHSQGLPDALRKATR